MNWIFSLLNSKFKSWQQLTQCAKHFFGKVGNARNRNANDRRLMPCIISVRFITGCVMSVRFATLCAISVSYIKTNVSDLAVCGVNCVRYYPKFVVCKKRAINVVYQTSRYRGWRNGQCAFFRIITKKGRDAFGANTQVWLLRNMCGISRPVTSLGHQGSAELSERVPNFLN